LEERDSDVESGVEVTPKPSDKVKNQIGDVYSKDINGHK
jgi:hypothetical protein